MKLNDRLIAKFEALWKKGYTQGEIAWMLDISIEETGDLVHNYYKTRGRWND